jgi:hypothetical protein
MYDEILAAVKARSGQIDFIFFTGDLAYSGIEAEYKLLRDCFLTPLRGLLPSGCLIFTVPGNHDVNRKRSVNPRTWIEDEDEQAAFQKVDEDGRQKRVDVILPRFEAYREIEREFGAWGVDWLASETGAICTTVDAARKKVAIVGINTAWLCHDDEDWGRLTAGKTMVEAALKKADDAELTIVLGHHPLAAMTGEKSWSDGSRIRQRLQQANAIYLHGHLHKSGGQIASDSMQSVLAIQAPSGFQAADSDRWRNGIMWGEIDFGAESLIIEPLRWNDDHRAFVFDSDAARPELRFTGRDAFAFPLPGQQLQVATAKTTLPTAPTGWSVIDTACLAELTATRPSAAEMADWFNGAFPTWAVASALDVRPRQIVDNLVNTFRGAAKAAPQPVVRLLTGAGGEGKSAALLQTAAGLVRQTGLTWTCLWRQSAAANVPTDLSPLLPRKDGHAWIIAIDDAESAGPSLPDALRKLGPRTDVHVILAAREADWILRGNTVGQWHGIADFRSIPMAGIDEEDANRIAVSWAAWGDEAMGHLRGRTVAEAAKALFGHAKEFAVKKEEGALLGALLMTREGEDYRQRVARLMAPMRGAPGIGKHSLLDIYAMIAAMHAENQLYLSRQVLAYALNCEEGDLDGGPLRTLRREAMVDGGTAYVLTRHRLIAEVARDWLEDEGHDVGRFYPFLAIAARKRSRDKREPLDVAKFQFDLPKHFVDQGGRRAEFGVNIAKALWLCDSDNYSHLTSYASLLRRMRRSPEALALFAENARRFPGHRGVLYEWGVTAGDSGDQGLSIWLDARSLADDRTTPISQKNAKLSLAGMGRAFEELSKSTRRQDYGKV